MAAASVAETMPTGSGPGAAPNEMASGFAASALECAKAGSDTAAGLTETAISTAVAVAQARSESVLEETKASHPAAESMKPVVGKAQRSKSKKKNEASMAQILSSMF